jgi:hypothetical protein
MWIFLSNNGYAVIAIGGYFVNPARTGGGKQITGMPLLMQCAFIAACRGVVGGCDGASLCQAVVAQWSSCPAGNAFRRGLCGGLPGGVACLWGRAGRAEAIHHQRLVSAQVGREFADLAVGLGFHVGGLGAFDEEQ